MIALTIQDAILVAYAALLGAIILGMVVVVALGKGLVWLTKRIWSS